MKKTTTTPANTNTNTNTQTTVKAQPQFSPNYLAKLQAEKDMLKALAKPTPTPIEEAMKIVKATTTKNQPQKPMKTTTTTTQPIVKATVTPDAKKPNPRSVQVTEKDANHFGIAVGDVCTIVEATNGNVLTAQVTSHYFNVDNKRSATHLILLGADGKPTTKKLNVYTIRLTKVTPTPTAKVTPIAKVKATAKAKA